MRKYIIILLVITGLLCLGFRAPKPPNFTKIDETNIAQLNDVLEDYWNILNGRYTLNIVTANPDGSSRGNVGDMVLFNNSGTYYLEVNVGGTVWKGVLLQDTP